jgi:heme A synthase
MKPGRGFAIYAWTVLGVNILVILWGAFVRASGSGAGCGSHWPLCNGVAIPVAPAIETIIEFVHRLTSGAALILVVGQLIWAWRAYPKDNPVRLGAGFSMLFIITEALLGAGLVLFKWVAQDASLGRVISQGAHLVNTFLLLASLALTAWWASGGSPVGLKGRSGMAWLLGIGLAGVLFLGASGAINALGDTLFPVSSLAEGIAQDVSPTAHFLLRLRVIHPVLAILTGMYVIFATGLTAMFREERRARKVAVVLAALVLLQLSAGLINVVLLAPTWMQIVHLLLADLVWIGLVLFSAEALADRPPQAVPSPNAASASTPAAHPQGLD